MKREIYISLLMLISYSISLVAQHDPFCGFDEYEQLLLQNAEYQSQTQQEEKAYRAHARKPKIQKRNNEVTIPVVFHIIHNNGPENISDAQVLQGLAHLNQAFANEGAYQNDDGVDTKIRFCLARRDDKGNEINGIYRYESPYTDMSIFEGYEYVKSRKIDSTSFINIQIVKNVCLGSDCSTAGFAGEYRIVVAANTIDNTPSKATVLVHEMGHYLGLKHTWHGGCKNDDCLKDGDKVCDTPPDNRTYDGCTAPSNSCFTDEDDTSNNNPYRSLSLGGLGDQPDDKINFMDYNIPSCREKFTQGQADRMFFFLENMYAGLLDSKGCLPPCETFVTAEFDLPDSIAIGSSLNITNQSNNADTYQWYIDGNPVSTSEELTHTFLDEGLINIQLEAYPNDTLCESDIIAKTIRVYCPIESCFDNEIQGQYLIFEDCSQNADDIEWSVYNGSGDELYSSTLTLDSIYINNIDFVRLCLRSSGEHCDDYQCQYITITSDGSEICNNGEDDDGDGLIDLFDPDCPCEDDTYQASCPPDCEIIPDSFPNIKMKLKWESGKLNNQFASTISKYVVGDLDGDNISEVVSSYSIGDINNAKNYISVLTGFSGTIIDTFRVFPEYDFFAFPFTPSLVRQGLTNDTYIYLYQLGELVCFDYTGSELFRSSHPSVVYSPSIADFNADGIAEVYCGDVVFNGLTGDVLFIGRDRDCTKSGNCDFFQPVAADVLGNDNIPEIITGKYVYQVNIANTIDTSGNTANIIEAPLGIEDGRCAVSDMNGDGLLDIIVSRRNYSQDLVNGSLSIWDPRTGAVLGSIDNPPLNDFDNSGSIPFVGDVDGDCTPEIGVVYKRLLRMYKYVDGVGLEILYDIPTSDDSGFTGVTMFDFNQDGKQELVYRDETSLRIFEGATGVTIDSFPLFSGTGSEYPIVADVDNDGQAEIIVSGSRTSQDEVRMYCFESASTPWAPARSVWNQYAYNPTQVNDDLTIPRYQQNAAQPLQGTENCPRETCNTPYNNFMAQATMRTQEGCYVWPDEDCPEDEEICGNEEDDDGDGLIDLFDPDCPCEDDTYQASCPPDCEIIPDTFPDIKMKMKWESDVLVSTQVTPSNYIVGDIDDDGNVEIATISSTGDLFNTTNSISVIQGLNGLKKRSFDIIPSYNFTTLSTNLSMNRSSGTDDPNFVFNHDFFLHNYDKSGTLLFSSIDPVDYDSSIGFADFMNNGSPLLYCGAQIFNSKSGNLVFHGDRETCDNGMICRDVESVTADVIGEDGRLELITGSKVYILNITNQQGINGNSAEIVNAPSNVYDGKCAVADINGDNQLDVISVKAFNNDANGGIWIWDPRSETQIASQLITSSNPNFGMDVSIPFIGDVDGDCLPEIGVVSNYKLNMFKYVGIPELQLMYSISTSDESGRTGVTMFDFNQDGNNELIYRDENYLRIIEGSTGITLDSTIIISKTWEEYPVIADVDNDGQAEIIVSGSRTSQDEVRMYCFESASTPWAPARSVWNQYAYNPTQVNDDLTIPRYQQNAAQPLQGTENCPRETCNTPYNNFMAQATTRTQEGCYVWPDLQRDLTISAESKCVGDSLEICFYISSTDTIIISQGVPINCYPPPWDEGNGVVTQSIDEIIVTNDTTCIMMPMLTDIDSLLIVVNDDEGFYPNDFPITDIEECDYTNNEFVLQLGGPDFSIDIIDWECSPDSLIFYIATDNVGLDTDVSCIGGGCYFNNPNGIGIDPREDLLEVTTWCFDYDSITMSYQYQDTFRVAIPHPTGQSQMWWTINEGGFGPGLLSSKVTGIYECNYNNNIDGIVFDISEKMLDLGPDIIKCSTEVFTLHAGSGFENYLWNDLTTDSIYSAVAEGLHNVEATDQCGRIYRDTIMVNVDDSDDLDLGDDISLCYDQDTIMNIVGDYDEVFWTPSEKVDCDTCMSTTIFVDTTTILYVQARKDNCMSYDTITIERILPELDTITMTSCLGDTIDFYGQSIMSSGIYENLSLDCSRLEVVEVIFTMPDSTELVEQICSSDSILFDGQYLTNQGVYNMTTQNILGCDSTIILDLEVVEELANTDTLHICENDSIQVFGEWISIDTTVTQSYISSVGCDSTQTISVISNSLLPNDVQIQICEGDSVFLYGEWYKNDGYYDALVSNIEGCDSLIFLEIVTKENFATYDTIIACQGDTIQVFAATLTNSEDVWESYVAENGCDSVSYYHVEFVDELESSEEVLLCPGDSILINSEWIKTEGEFETMHVSEIGCDSIHKVYVYMVANPPIPETEIDCEQLEIILGIDPQSQWQVIWSNGDITNQTLYPSGVMEASLVLHTQPNCEKKFTITLPQLPNINDIPTILDTTVTKDQSITIDLGLDPNEWTVLWNDASIVDCDTCMQVEISPSEDTEITVYLSHQSGCTYESSFLINLEDGEEGIFVPNIFSPNSDSNNDGWSVFSTANIQITACNVFDRWGNLVYTTTGNQPEWDGKFNGNKAEQGVYVYIIRYIDSEGKQQIKIGDLTLIR